MIGYLNRSIVYKVIISACLALLLYIITSCSQILNSYNMLPHPKYISEEYNLVLKKWTKKASIHKGLKTELLVAATYKGENFRKAYAKEYGRIHLLDIDHGRIIMDDQIKASMEYDDFLVSLYTQEKQLNDFSEKNSIWSVYLIRDEHSREVPLEIRKIKKKRKLYEFFYPYISPWSSVYVFRFKINDHAQSSKSIKLILTGAPGSVRLNWER